MTPICSACPVISDRSSSACRRTLPRLCSTRMPTRPSTLSGSTTRPSTLISPSSSRPTMRGTAKWRWPPAWRCFASATCTTNTILWPSACTSQRPASLCSAAPSSATQPAWGPPWRRSSRARSPPRRFPDTATRPRRTQARTSDPPAPPHRRWTLPRTSRALPSSCSSMETPRPAISPRPLCARCTTTRCTTGSTRPATCCSCRTSPRRPLPSPSRSRSCTTAPSHRSDSVRSDAACTPRPWTASVRSAGATSKRSCSRRASIISADVAWSAISTPSAPKSAARCPTITTSTSR
mmetsp:Transcript_163058/g.396221  ORF Transcript_163058/g.396221 Transcript_163058/m.396221 type:complete len:294 (-) Transcript_163058:651-1532(-)